MSHTSMSMSMSRSRSARRSNHTTTAASSASSSSASTTTTTTSTSRNCSTRVSRQFLMIVVAAVVLYCSQFHWLLMLLFVPSSSSVVKVQQQQLQLQLEPHHHIMMQNLYLDLDFPSASSSASLNAPSKDSITLPAIITSSNNHTTTTTSTTTSTSATKQLPLRLLDVCFVASTYGQWASHADRLQNVRILDFYHNHSDNDDDDTNRNRNRNRNRNNSNFNNSHHQQQQQQQQEEDEKQKVHFLVFTNLPRLVAPGWHKLIRPHPEYRRYITQSRHAKFFAWNDTYVQQHCQVVFYMDSIGHVLNHHHPNHHPNHPNDDHNHDHHDKNGNTKNENTTTTTTTFQEIQDMARAIWESPQGHAQYLHRGGGGAMGEFRRIEVFQKDIPKNIQASKDYLRQQPDVESNPAMLHNCTLYENRYIGYAVGRPTTFAKAASECLWPRYSLEVDSWRDQPLWCYCLDHLHITPIPLANHKKIWKLEPKRMGRQGHKYKTEEEASAATKMQK